MATTSSTTDFLGDALDIIHCGKVDQCDEQKVFRVAFCVIHAILPQSARELLNKIFRHGLVNEAEIQSQYAAEALEKHGLISKTSDSTSIEGIFGPFYTLTESGLAVCEIGEQFEREVLGSFCDGIERDTPGEMDADL